MNASTVIRMEAAERIADELAQRSLAVDAVCVYGSVARGDSGPESDIDLLVIGDGRVLSNRTVRGMVPREVRPLRPVVTFYTWRDLEVMLSAKTSFAAHLANEGRVLLDRTGELRRTLRAHAGSPLAIQDELAHQLRRLQPLEDTTQFNGNFLFCLAQLYIIGKAVVMLRLAGEGRPEYNKERAFREFARQHPDLATEVETVAGLKPFYQRVTRRQTVSLPYSYRSADDRIATLIEAIRRLGALP